MIEPLTLLGAGYFDSLTTYANEIKFDTDIVHYIINNLVKKIGLSRVNFC